MHCDTQTMAHANLQLPAAYVPIFFDQIVSLRSKAIELAQQGHQEGTLLVATDQTAAKGRLGKQWVCSEGDLHCALILRPDFEVENYYQMLIVASVSLGNALATFVSPMTALGYQWPNDVCIANHKVASLWLDHGLDNNDHWLCITASCNIFNHPDDDKFISMSVSQAIETGELSHQQLLESYCREFIKQINFWSQRGFAYVFDQWRIRLENIGQGVELQVNGQSIHGVFEDIDENGSAYLRDQASQRCIRIDDYMELNG